MGPREIAYGCEPAVLIFADTTPALRSWRDSATAAGGRVAAALSIAEATARLDEQAHVDTVVVDCRRDHGDLLDRLLDRLDQAARTGRHASVVSVAPALIDAAAARCSHDGVMVLSTSGKADRLSAAAAMFGKKRGLRFHDRGEDTPGELHLPSDEIGRIARTLAALSGEQGAPSGNGHATLATDEPLSAAAIRAIIRTRRLRDQFFDGALFADPAWDMLLDLTAARIERRPVAISSLCIAAAVPPTTALRWIKTLTDAGVFVRVADPRDGRRIFIELSDTAARAMATYFAAADRLGASFA